jgi:hypothetical protein
MDNCVLEQEGEGWSYIDAKEEGYALSIKHFFLTSEIS